MDLGIGVAISQEDPCMLCVVVGSSITHVFQSEFPVPLDVWHEVVGRHFAESCEKPLGESDGWMFNVMEEIRLAYGGSPVLPAQPVEWVLPSEEVSNG